MILIFLERILISKWVGYAGTANMSDSEKSGNTSSLMVGAVIQGLMLPEPIRVIFIQEMGSSLKIEGEGLHTGQHRQVILSELQLKEISISPPEETFGGDAFRFRLGIEARRLGLAYEYDPYFSLSIARVDPVPHQLEAVYDFILPLPRIRFLLADDAGAGKTIMAGLLLKELKIRGLVNKTLIVTPANLSFQWQRELQDKFREKFEILRGPEFRSQYGVNPWLEKPQIITSMDWAKREDIKDKLERVPSFDLIIVDEAHKMSASDPDHKTDRYVLGELLSQKADHYLLLTATPHKGDPLNFCLFLQLLDKDVYGDVKSLQDAMQRNYAPFYLRRTKEAMVTFPDPETGEVKKIFTKRDVRTVRFELDEEESDFYLALTRYVEDQSIRAAADLSPRGRALGFTMALYQRRFASSMHAIRRSLERRKEKLEKQLKRPEAVEFDEKVLEELEDLPEDEAEQQIEKIEEASLSVDTEALRQEIAELQALIDKANILEQREVESKLRKLHEILTKENIFKDPKTKLLIFTEHRDTLEYLAGRHSGLRWEKGKLEEWGLKVTQIHGGMRPGDRDTPRTRLYAEQEFRDTEGAQVLVATEAAGEGINLQFCWIMINYDIPWNPMRLEQRMGRIHRYGQEHDCVIFNFVAANTREGQVLEKLWERLKEIRKELGTDKVFDVVGDVFPATQLERMMRDLYARRTTLQNVLDRVVTDMDPERFKKITESALEGLAKKELNLSVIIGKKELAKERRLVPEVVQQFFLQSAPIVGLTSVQEKGGIFRIGRLPRNLLQVGERLEPRYGPLAREYKWIAFDRKPLSDDPTIEWVTPGHPLFETVCDELLSRVRMDLQNGCVFFDLHRTQSSLLDVFEASVLDGRGRTLHRRLFVVETSVNGNSQIRQPTIFLDLNPAPKGVNPPFIDALPLKSKIESFLYETALVPFLEEIQEQRVKETEIIRRHVALSLNELINSRQLQLATLIERQQKRGEELSGLIAQAEARLDELNDRLEKRMSELTREQQLTIGDIAHIGRAWVLPHPERTSFAPMIADEEIEKIAMARAMSYEKEQGWDPEDVSEEDRGFDILSKDLKSGSARFIEVKGRATVGEIALTKNEHDTAGRLKQDYWLYVVFDCATIPRLIPIKDPSRLDWEPVVKIDYFTLSPDKIPKAGGEQKA
jgi:superfamily II DNA or RNA helicase